MSMKINNTIYNQTYQPVAQQSNAENSTFSLPTQSSEEVKHISISDVFEANCEGKGIDINSDEAQKAWLSNAIQLPEGIGLTGKRMMEFLESQAAPIIYNFEELYNKFGINVQWEYENGYPVRGIVESSAENHRAFIRMKAYMDNIAIQQIDAGNKFVTHPNSVLYEGLNL
ncbi:hypothetical protein [Anaerosporobacter sp.]|uniref:hypothetical protein n=1 Tax=Anaerosporobacter sp. TaxID=1872529 RepID=UPI00286F293D|nr:hypothetical protein [Anaerosporobacter sp.]